MAAGVAGSLWMLAAGCSEGQSNSKHESVSAEKGTHVIACQMCYDEAKTTDQQYGKSASFPATHIIHQHKCESCNAEVTVYTQDGRPMIKCPKCAPNGVACDLCAPPKASS